MDARGVAGDETPIVLSGNTAVNNGPGSSPGSRTPPGPPDVPPRAAHGREHPPRPS